MDVLTVVQAEPDFQYRAWWLDEFGCDNRPYTEQEWPSCSSESSPDLRTRLARAGSAQNLAERIRGAA